ncbi:hypothetical protein [Bacillus seohaeanensis]|uniref:Uncharacterized protein n=1 Tax=Bacillus seohaeanensis TaxID=284580 RepID=A0ABW5RTZ9_9BACI
MNNIWKTIASKWRVQFKEEKEIKTKVETNFTQTFEAIKSGKSVPSAEEDIFGDGDDWDDLDDDI